MACVRIIWISFVSVFFGVFSEGVPVGKALITTDMDISNSGIGHSARSLFENIDLPDSRERSKIDILNENNIKEVEGIPVLTVNIVSLLYGNRRNEYSNKDVNMEKSTVLSPKLGRSSGLKSEELSKPAIGNDDEAEKEPISRKTNYKPRTFEKANDIEMADDTVSYADIVIGSANYDMEPANVNIPNNRGKREAETTERTKGDIFDVDRSSVMNNMNTLRLDGNDVPNTGGQFSINKVKFRVQLEMEFDTDDIPPDIKTDGILKDLNFKRSPAEAIGSETQKKATVSVISPENIEKIMLEGVNGDIDSKPFQKKQTTQSNGYSRIQNSKYNPNENVKLQSIVEDNTKYAISSMDMHTEGVSMDVDVTTETENILDESPRGVVESNATKIDIRSGFDDDYPSASNEDLTDVSAATTDEVNTYRNSITDSVTEIDTPQHTSFRSIVSRDIKVEGAPEVSDAQTVMEKRLERFMFMEMGLGVVIIFSSVTTVIQVMVLVKKFKAIRNKYECTAVP